MPTSRPLSFFKWATNVNYAGGPDIGTPTKVAPSGGRFADGWRKDDVPPAQEQNYWQYQMGAWLDWIDHGWMINAAMAALDSTFGLVDGSIIHINGSFGGGGDYRYETVPPYSPDGRWIVNGSAVEPGGAFTNTILGMVNLAMLAPLGTVPGGWANGATNKLDPKFIPWGFFVGGYITGGSDTTTLTTALTTTTGDTVAIGGSDHTVVGAVKAGDVLCVGLDGWGFNTSGKWAVGVYASFDGGATWIVAGPPVGGGTGGAMSFDTNASGTGVAVPLSFEMEVPSDGTCWLRWKFQAATVGTTNLYWGNGRYYVLRAPNNSWP